MEKDTGLVDETGSSIKTDVAEPARRQVETTEEGHLGSVEVDGKMVKVVNSCTMIQIVVHKLEDGREVQQLIAQDFMMVDHKAYMVKLCTYAIDTIMKTTNKKASLIKAVSAVVAHKLGLMGRKDLRSKKW
jgi:hypothetical protein